METAKFGFFLLTAMCYFLVFNIFFINSNNAEQSKKYKYRFLTVAAIWTVTITILSLSGFLADFSTIPPKMAIVFIVPLVLLIFIINNKRFTSYLQNIAPWKIILLQFFRVPVELLLYLLYKENISPVQMTFEGRNLDILTGLLAPIAAYIIYKKPNYFKPVGLFFNLTGLILLINILVIAILSFPTAFRQFMNEPSNTAVTLFPIVFLPGLLVPLAYYLHAFSLNQIVNKRTVKI
jgi:hypothetical protein